MSDENFNNLSDSLTQTRKLLKEKKFEGWRNYCRSISPSINPSVVWRNIRRFRNGISESTNSVLPPNLYDEFLNNLAPPTVPEQDFFCNSVPPIIHNNSTILYSPFVLQELLGVLSTVKNTAPGEDGIPYSFLAKLSEPSLLYYLNLINTTMLSGNIPKSWKSQLVIPILKPGKAPTEISSYRPIALSSVLVKVAENLVKNRLEWIIENRNILPESQFGFRKGRSTLDSVGTFVTTIRVAFSRNESVVATFLDLESAYDNVLLNVLKSKLHKLDIPEILSCFIFNLMSGRSIKLDQGISADLCGKGFRRVQY